MKKYVAFVLIFQFSVVSYSQNNIGFNFIGADITDVKEKLNGDSFWEFNGEVVRENYKEILIIKKGKKKPFVGYGAVKLKENKVFELVFYIDKKFEEALRKRLSSFYLISKDKWKSKSENYICFIEDEELIEVNEIGFSVSKTVCDGKQKD